jgi:hypothetical protein
VDEPALDEGRFLVVLRVGQDGGCCAQACAEQDAAGGQASLLRADPVRMVGG